MQRITDDVIIKRNREAFAEKQAKTPFLQKLRSNFSLSVKYAKAARELEKLKDINFIAWASDETQLNNQLPVLKVLAKEGYKSVVLSNKDRIVELVRKDGIDSFYIPITATNMIKGGQVGAIADLFYGLIKKSPELKFALIGNDLRWDDRAVCLMLQGAGIRTAVINHGLNVINPDLDKIVCDVHFAWSEAERQNIIRAGKNPENIFATGSPAMDETLSSPEFATQKAIDDFLKSNRVDKFVLVTFSGPGGKISLQNHLKNIALLKENAAAFEKHGYKAVFKLHKKDNPQHYGSLFDSGIFVLIPTDNKELNVSIFPWLKRANMAISGPSGSMVDAMLMKVPALYCDVMQEGVDIDFVKENVVPVIGQKSLPDYLGDAETKEAELDKWLETQNEYVKKLYGDTMGKSAEMIKKILLSEYSEEIAKN